MQEAIENAGYLRPVVANLVPIFFALSGFLVAGSLERCLTTSGFIGLRIIRIYPALAVEVVLSSLIVGPLFTRFLLPDYVENSLFRNYFWNFIGDVQYKLPGVFDEYGAMHESSVNGQLWTVPFELLCYVILAALALVGIKHRRIAGPFFIFSSMGLYLLRHMLKYGAPLVYVPMGLVLVWAFLCGMALFMYRDRILWDWRYALVSIAVSTCVLLPGVADGWRLMLPFSLAYLTVYLGLTDIRRGRILGVADYSYGIYLYHWVFQQVAVAVAGRTWYAIAAISIPLTVLFSAVSWHYVEKPALSLKRYIVADDDRRAGPALWMSASAALLLAGCALWRHLA